MRKASWIIAGLAVASGAAAALAQDRARLPAECRQEIVKLCGSDRSHMRSCLAEKRGELSSTCQQSLRERIQQRQGDAGRSGLAARQTGAEEIAYGGDPLQRLDFYAANAKQPAPLVLFVHGGGWKRGDKNNATGQFKAPHYNGQGYHFASINYRLVPNATVEQQAADVAGAVAKLIAEADQRRIDRRRIVLMGHSAGAHLVALVGTDPQYLRAAGLSYRDIAGVIPLDGAAYNVPDQMDENARLMGDTYQQAFGTDPDRQKALSPTFHAAAPNAPAFLILHVQRRDGTEQSRSLAAALRKAGTTASVQGFEGRGMKGHAEINRQLGDPDYPATPVVDDWLKQLFG